MEPKNKINIQIQFKDLNLKPKTIELLVKSGIISLKDLVKMISTKLSKKPDASLKDATIECLLNIRRFGREEADDLMKELKSIRFFDCIDWDYEVEQRRKEQDIVSQKKKDKIEARKAAKAAKALARGEE
ncbi:MAG: hypothetical protein IKI57_06225 [Clostridia bacterium]|jgi:hypothetical protein|nr:hypothetical protein [Clostridia bacterium]